MSETSKSIVIVDDDENALRALAAILQRRGFTPYTAATGAAGRALIAEKNPALVMLDLGLPDANGIDLLREALAANPDLPVIILTGQDTLENALSSITGGALHFLSKPVDTDVLLDLVDRALGNKT